MGQLRQEVRLSGLRLGLHLIGAFCGDGLGQPAMRPDGLSSRSAVQNRFAAPARPGADKPAADLGNTNAKPMAKPACQPKALGVAQRCVLIQEVAL
jgi:hypothetical protein